MSANPRPLPLPERFPVPIDPEQVARDRCRDAVAQAEGTWLELQQILPARAWFIIERDGPPDADGDAYRERTKAHRVKTQIDATRRALIDDYGACDERLDIAFAKFIPIYAAFTALAAIRRAAKGKY